MKFSRVTRILAIAFVLAFSGAAVTTANAQVHRHHRVIVVGGPYFFPHYYYPGYYQYYDPIAYQREQGYRDGLSRGKDDAKHGRADSPSSHKHYTHSDSLTYREAFVQGYEDGYKARMG